MSPNLSEQTSLRPAVVATPNGSRPRPSTVAVDVLLLYTRGDDLLVGLRQGGYAAGEWDIPSGKLDPRETLEQGVAREAREETGLHLPPDRLSMVAMTHCTLRAAHRGWASSSTQRPTRACTVNLG